MLMDGDVQCVGVMANERGGTGVLLGFGLGLLGLGLALSLVRPKCPRCPARVDNGAPYCPTCGVSLAWPNP
jgi:hypothetical protein